MNTVYHFHIFKLAYQLSSGILCGAGSVQLHGAPSSYRETEVWLRAGQTSSKITQEVHCNNLENHRILDEELTLHSVMLGSKHPGNVISKLLRGFIYRMILDEVKNIETLCDEN